MAYRAAFKIPGQSTPSYNALVFETADEAKRYGAELRSRWSGTFGFEVEEIDLEVNYQLDQKGKLLPVEDYVVASNKNNSTERAS